MAAAALPALAEPLTYAQLKTMVENMGYTPNEISKNAEGSIFEVTVSTASFNVPIAFEVSKSTRYIWARASLGPSKLTGEKALEALKKNAETQPTVFWITASGNLVIGMAIDNREVTPAHLRFVIDKVAADVGATSSVWGG